MKTNLRKLFLLAIILLTPSMVQAASSCSYSEQAELNNIVANVKATYEIVDVYGGKAIDFENGKEENDEVDYYVKGLKISILNITDDIYVKVTSKNDNKEYTFKSSDTENGIATIETTDIYELNTYTIEVYANKYSCAGERFRTITLTTPMYNYYSQLEICENNPDYYYCQEFISTENVDAEHFYPQVEQYEKQKEEQNQQKEEKNKNFIDKLKDFYNNNKLIIYSVGIVIVVAGVATTVILIKKKRSRVL